MLKKFAGPRKNLSVPLTPSLRVGLEQARADIWAVRASDETYNRRNALLICGHTDLPKILIPEVFKNSELFVLDWKGEDITKPRCNYEIIKPLAQGANIKTVCILDVDLMNKSKIELIDYCLDNVQPSTGFVFVSSSTEYDHLFKQRSGIYLDCTQRSREDRYAIDVVKYFRELFKQLSEMVLSDKFFAETKPFLSSLPPDMVAQLHDAFYYQYTEARFAGVYLNTDEFRLSLFQQAIKRLKQSSNLGKETVS